MGQQQLLLVILVTIIVGIATVVAINTFGAAADSANVDAVRQDLASIGASAQGFYMKPAMLGGGNRTFTDITFGDIAFGAQVTAGTGDDPDEARNDNGTYTLAPVAQFILVTANPASGGEIQARICPDTIVMGAYAETGTVTAPGDCPG